MREMHIPGVDSSDEADSWRWSVSGLRRWYREDARITMFDVKTERKSYKWSWAPNDKRSDIVEELTANLPETLIKTSCLTRLTQWKISMASKMAALPNEATRMVFTRRRSFMRVMTIVGQEISQTAAMIPTE
jgi:hypothetical protein